VRSAFLTGGIYRVSIIDVPLSSVPIVGGSSIVVAPSPQTRKSLRGRESEGFNRIRNPPLHPGNAELDSKGVLIAERDIHSSFKDTPVLLARKYLHSNKIEVVKTILLIHYENIFSLLFFV
jgi:hypothetical protein